MLLMLYHIFQPNACMSNLIMPDQQTHLFRAFVLYLHRNKLTLIKKYTEINFKCMFFCTLYKNENL